MARLARVVIPGMPHHITQRGNRRQPTFFCDDDYAAYLELMGQWCKQRGVEVWAYCLMPNHVHLIAVPESEDTWVSLDFETATGSRDSACALGIAVIENGRVVSSSSWLIKPPGNDYSSWNIRVHGIRPEDTRSSPDYADLYPSICDLLEGRFVLAHWASFDMSVLRSVHASYGIPLPNLRYACSCAMARRAFPALPNHKLPTVCDHCGIVLEHHHDAAEDAVACAEVALHCRRTTGTRSLHEAVRLLVDGPRRL